jgi:hypothetical protein
VSEVDRSQQQKQYPFFPGHNFCFERAKVGFFRSPVLLNSVVNINNRGEKRMIKDLQMNEMRRNDDESEFLSLYHYNNQTCPFQMFFTCVLHIRDCTPVDSCYPRHLVETGSAIK